MEDNSWVVGDPGTTPMPLGDFDDAILAVYNEVKDKDVFQEVMKVRGLEFAFGSLSMIASRIENRPGVGWIYKETEESFNLNQLGEKLDAVSTYDHLPPRLPRCLNSVNKRCKMRYHTRMQRQFRFF